MMNSFASKPAAASAPDRTAWWAVSLLTLMSLLLKLHKAFDHPLLGDELFERAGARDSQWLEFLTWTHSQSFHDTPPLTFALYRLLVLMPGLDGEVAWRLPGILAGAFCVPLMFILARRAFAKWPALLAAALCAVDLNLGWNSQIARPYPFLIFFLLAGLVVGSGSDRPGRLLTTFLLFTAAMWTHLFAFLFVTGAVLAALTVWYVQDRFRRWHSRPVWFWAAVLALVGSAPFFLIFRVVGDLRQPEDILGAPKTWAQALATIRWQIGLLTWVRVPFANPLIWLATLSALAWWTTRRSTATVAAILGGGCAVVAAQFYTIWHHEFLEPRYLLGASVMLWMGAGAVAELLVGRRYGARALTAVLIFILPLQAWRAWHNQDFYGTISRGRESSRRLKEALVHLRETAPHLPVTVLPEFFVLRESIARLGVSVAAPNADRHNPNPRQVYLLAGGRAVSRRHGNPVARFVESRLVQAGIPPEERAKVLAACEEASWTVWVENGQFSHRHF